MELARARDVETSHKSVHAELRQCAQGNSSTGFLVDEPDKVVNTSRGTKGYHVFSASLLSPYNIFV